VTEALTFHCPRCGESVSATSDAATVSCPRCETPFSPWGTPTIAPRERVEEAPPSGDPLLGTTVGGRRLLRVLGRGGMGAVYEAEDRSRGRVAVKVLPETLASDGAFVSRFRREASTLAALSHPHLVEVFERGEDDGRFWFAMELVPGESLRRRLERGPLPWGEAVRVTQEVLLGLGYAHGRGVAHRDLKPENVLLATDGRARLVDFGLSRIVRGESAEDTARLTRTNVILGTYEYMAPEQRLGHADVDERADLYALGVILYECLTGALPLGRFPAASEARPGTPSSLDAVVHRALAPRPADRFPSAAAFREALEEAAAQAATTPPPARPVPSVGAIVPAAASGLDPRVEDARGFLRQVEILSSLDRAMGFVLLLLAAGLWGVASRQLRPVASWFAIFGSLTTAVFVVSGFLLLKQARRLAALEKGAREAQVTASVFLLFLAPPFGTAVGIYGLVVMTTQAARDAFALGRARLLAPPAAIVPVPPLALVGPQASRASRRHGRFWPRAALLFGLGVALVSLVPALRDPHRPPLPAFAVLGGALALAAVWARYGRFAVVRFLAWAAVFAAVFALYWTTFVGAQGREGGGGRDRSRWEWTVPRLRTG
jgi:hypothetical protein